MSLGFGNTGSPLGLRPPKYLNLSALFSPGLNRVPTLLSKAMTVTLGSFVRVLLAMGWLDTLAETLADGKVSAA